MHCKNRQNNQLFLRENLTAVSFTKTARVYEDKSSYVYRSVKVKPVIEGAGRLFMRKANCLDFIRS